MFLKKIFFIAKGPVPKNLSTKLRFSTETKIVETFDDDSWQFSDVAGDYSPGFFAELEKKTPVLTIDDIYQKTYGDIRANLPSFSVENSVNSQNAVNSALAENNLYTNSKFFSSSLNSLEGAAFYQMGTLSHYNVWFHKSSFPLNWFTKKKGYAEFFYKHYSNLPANIVSYSYKYMHRSLCREKLFYFRYRAKYPWARYNMDVHLENQPGTDWGVSNSNKHLRDLYNTSNAHMHWEEMQLSYHVYKIHRHFDRQIRGYMSTREFAQSLYVSTHRMYRTFFTKRYTNLPYYFETVPVATNPHNDLTVYSFIHTRLHNLDFGPGRRNVVFAHKFIPTHVRRSYDPTYILPSEYMDLIYQKQDWLTLLNAKSHEVQSMLIKSKLIVFREINHFYNIVDNQFFDRYFTFSFALFLIVFLVVYTIAEMTVSSDVLYAMYKKYYSANFRKDFNFNFSIYTQKRTKLPFIEWVLLFAAGLLIFAHQPKTTYSGHYNGEGNAFRYYWDYFRNLLQPKRFLAILDYPKTIESRFEGRYYPRWGEDHAEHLTAMYPIFYDHRDVSVRGHTEGTFLLSNDIMRAAKANLKLSYDQAIYNFYRSRNGYFLGSGHFYTPGMERIDSMYTMRTPLTHVGSNPSRGMPLWFFREMDRSLGFFRFQHRSLKDVLSNRVQFIESSYLDKQGKFLPPRYCIVFGPRPKWWFTNYYGVVNEKNQTPLYDAELLRVRYAFNPFFSNYTSYGNNWLRTIDALSVEDKIDIPFGPENLIS